MAVKNVYVEWVVEWLAALGEITVRRMMGGHVVYCNGLTFALISDSTLYLKADVATRPKFEALGLKPFRPFGEQGMTLSYYPAPPEFFEDVDVMVAWGRESIAVAKRAAAKKKGRSPKKRAAKV